MKKMYRRMTREEAIDIIVCLAWHTRPDEEDVEQAIKVLEQEPRIKVLERDEVIRRLGTVDIYQANVWAELVNDLELLGLKICEVEKND